MLVSKGVMGVKCRKLSLDWFGPKVKVEALHIEVLAPDPILVLYGGKVWRFGLSGAPSSPCCHTDPPLSMKTESFAGLSLLPLLNKIRVNWLPSWGR